MEIDNFYKLVGGRIQRFRLAKKVSQEDLAKQLKISRLSVVNLESGKQKLSVDKLLIISHILQVSPLDIVPELGNSKEIDPNSKFLEENAQDTVLEALEEIKRNI